jgi:hypothetical protein
VFNLVLPDGWTDATMHIFAGPVEDDTQHTVSVMVDPGVGPNLDEYAGGQVQAIESTLKGLTIVRRETVSLWSGAPAARVVLEWLPTPGKRVIQEMLFVIKDGVGYRLTATFTPATFETIGPTVRAMLMSFEPA